MLAVRNAENSNEHGIRNAGRRNPSIAKNAGDFATITRPSGGETL
jgi:hypothetical protein